MRNERIKNKIQIIHDFNDYGENSIDEFTLTSSEPRGKSRLEGNLIEIKVSTRGRGKAERENIVINIMDILRFIQDDLVDSSGEIKI